MLMDWTRLFEPETAVDNNPDSISSEGFVGLVFDRLLHEKFAESQIVVPNFYRS
jgi:hypothetical protein